ncbi:glycosyltransferase family 39 protein, partial [Candidatus Gottesmanbacteria bacterium]|nr:glycosyltransferase family 39 protein [Candidatus Gottesmanbacteria bacterium]
YLFTRLLNLTTLPIFTDEAIYIRWAQIGSRDAAWRFISLVDGKQPLFVWFMMITVRLFRDPLLAGRIVSVASGLFTMIGVWFIAHELFRKKSIGYLSGMLYLLSPFSLLYDRMALYDSLVATFSVWNLYIAILLARRVRLDIALILGMTLGLGMLNKTSGFLSLYFLPLTLVLFDWGNPGRFRRIFRWIGFVTVAAVISLALYSVLRLSPLFNMVSQKDAVFIYPFRDWWVHPFQFFTGNIKGLFDWTASYLTRPIFFLALAPLFTLWEKPKEKLLLYAWWLAPFVALALFGRVLYPRFILFMIMPLLVLAALSFDWVIARFRGRLFLPIAALLLLYPSLSTDYFLIANPLYALIPRADKGQYVDDWPSGWGIREVNGFLEEQAKAGAVTVYTEGTFGLLPYAIEIYLVDRPNIEIRGIWPLPEAMPQEMLTRAHDHPTFVVLNQSQVAPQRWPLELIAEFQKGNRKDRKMRLFRVIVPIAKAPVRQ